MRACLGFLFIVCLAEFNATTVFAASATGSQNHYVKPEPKYAKWGKLAVLETQKRYPKASVVDYLHVARRTMSASTTQEVFKLWLRDDKGEFGVYVRILFNTKTEQTLNITFQETHR